MISDEESFLRKAVSGARDSGHIFPEYAACEAAIESGWGRSRLATEANNLFGQKQSQPPFSGTETMSLPTREHLNGKWVVVDANWARFSNWSDCFKARMRLLRMAKAKHPHYAAALTAESGEQFIREVSQTWSTDPDRARKVLAVYKAHRELLLASLPSPEEGQEDVHDLCCVQPG